MVDSNESITQKNINKFINKELFLINDEHFIVGDKKLANEK
jgi:hypothetical protein